MRIWDEAKKEELFSEGLATLDRAIKKFNPNKGMQFSTYASKALRMSFYGTMGREYRRNRKFPASYDPEKERPKKTLHSFSIGEEEIEEVRKILARNSANLDEREIEIIRKRYLSGGEIQTLEEVGKKIGVTKERTRQIQKNALEKLRKALRGSFDISRKE